MRQSALPAGVLPVAFGELESAANLSALGVWAGTGEKGLATGPAVRFGAQGGSVLAGTPERPLAWRLGLGQGTVTVLAVDPSLEPLSGWAATPALLKKAAEPALPGPDENEKMRYVMMMERDNIMQLQDAVNALPRDAYPDWRLVALILGGFALVAGPLLHLTLRRLDRRGLVWVAVPGFALLLSVVLYYAGIGRDGRDVLIHVVSHVRLDPSAGQAKQLLFAGFFAPTRQELQVTVPGDVPVRVGSNYGGLLWPGGPGVGEFRTALRGDQRTRHQGPVRIGPVGHEIPCYDPRPRLIGRRHRIPVERGERIDQGYRQERHPVPSRGCRGGRRPERG